MQAAAIFFSDFTAQKPDREHQGAVYLLVFVRGQFKRKCKMLLPRSRTDSLSIGRSSGTIELGPVRSELLFTTTEYKIIIYSRV